MTDGANDRIADLITSHALDVNRFEAGLRRQARVFLRELEGEIAAAITRMDPGGAVQASAKQRRLERLLVQVQDTIKASYRGERTRLIGALRELADIETDFAARAINTGLQFDMATVQITAPLLRGIVAGVLIDGAPVSEWWSRQAGDTLERFQDAMRAGIAQGETSAQLIRRVRGGTQNGERVAGLMDVTRRHADSLVRSATQAVSAAGRQEVYRQNANLLRGVLWTSTLDLRTTVVCAARDNKLYETVSHKPIGHDLPWLGGPGNLHWGCRSTSAPITKDWRDLGIDEDDLPPQTRASIDGEIPTDTDFEAWLSRRSVEQQDAVLGKGRADLWREKKLSFRDLIDGNGRELSLKELRERSRA